MASFKGYVPKDVVTLGVLRIERVGRARAVTHHPSFDSEPVKRYDIVGGRIARPERGPNFQFLVVGVGCRLVFEGDEDDVFIAGVIASNTKEPVEARDCVARSPAQA